MRVAILGAGGWGKNLVRVFCQILGAEGVLVCDPSEKQRSAMEQAYPGVNTSERNDYDAADAVIIAAPAVAHFELARHALRAGKHVLVEKPMTLTARDSEELISIANGSDRILMVDHLLEYHPAVVKLRELIGEGALGRIYHLTSQRLNLGVVRQEENALWSLAPHDISVMLDLLNEEPREVVARGEVYLQPGVEDVTHATLTFPSGVLGHVHSSWLDPVKVRRLTVTGDRCMAVFDDMAENKLVLFHHAVSQDEASGRISVERGLEEIVELPPAEPLRSMAETFLQSINTGIPPRSDGHDGLRVVRVLEQAQRSIERKA